VKQIRRSGQCCPTPGHAGNADALPSGTLARPAEQGVISNQSILTGGILHVTSFLVHHFPARGPRQQGRPCRHPNPSGPFNNSRTGGGGRVAAAGLFLDLLHHRQRAISTVPITSRRRRGARAAAPGRHHSAPDGGVDPRHYHAHHPSAGVAMACAAGVRAWRLVHPAAR
jgi:hypothetical protein